MQAMITPRRILCLIALATTLVPNWTFTLFRINVFRPYDINIIKQCKPQWPDQKFLVTGWAEIGTKTKAYNRHDKQVNPLQIFQPTLNALSMFFGFIPQNQQQEELIQRLRTIMPYVPPFPINETTAPLRGHIRFTGDFDYKAGFGINAWYQFPHDISFAVMVPFYSMQLKNVRMLDLTSTSDFDQNDVDTREFLTDNFAQVVALFDPTLNLNGWKKTGIGDITCMLQWQRDFPQGKPLLKNVTLNGRVGLSFPTGVKTDNNDLFSVPFGFDGSTTVIVGGGIDLDWFNCLPWINQIRGGLDVQFWQMFENTRVRRIKTDPTQTDLLPIVKERVNLNPGFAQTYNLYLEFHRLIRGLSLSASYQFIKQSRSHIALFDNQFSEVVADSAKSLNAWKVFQLLFAASYDCAYEMGQDSSVTPELKLIYKVPVGGKRVLAFDTVSIICSFTF